MGKMKDGFTLIEVITVSGIMALFSLTIISIFLATLRGGNKAQLLQKVHQDGDFALKTMAGAVRSGSSAICDNDLTVNFADGLTVVFAAIDDGEVTRVASDSSNFLTGKVATLSNLNFSCYDGYLGNQVVTIGFDLTAGDGSNQVQEKFSQSFATSASTRQY